VASGLRPDAVIERYYNFGGEGVLAGARLGAATVLEVNAPVIDYPGSPKALIDRALIVQPMRRWRERLTRLADLIVTPSAAILPHATPRHKIIELEWGADTDRFHPGAADPLPFVKPPGVVAAFAGAFRRWHGAVHLARALRLLEDRGERRFSGLFIGEGPELESVRRAASGLERVVFTGALAHDVMPAALAAADIGVAPFDTAAHPPLSLAFYWSPLKVFEYMASGLPVVAPRIERLETLVRNGSEGLLYSPPGPEALADTLVRLGDAGFRGSLGRAARERAVHEYSWKAHCTALAAAIEDVARARR
jgi:glycosyltransferase involved in cell wall biosynthesis